jgi:branched-chain amino acid transport system permease protein
MIYVLQNLIDAISLGCLYALFALSIAMIFGVARIVNFANGELMTVGGFSLLLSGVIGGVPTLLAGLGGVIMLSLAMERFAFRKIIKAPMPTLMVMSLGVSLLIQNILLIIFGSRPKGILFAQFLVEPLRFGALRISTLNAVTILVLAVLGGGLVYGLKRTSIGIQLRAAAEDFQMARLVGVRANRVVAASFAISGVMAAAAGMILALQVGTSSYNLGGRAVILGFIATVLGGLGSIAGAALGGFLIGFATVMAQIFLPPEVSPFRDAFVFAAVILILLFRPQGLFVAFGRGVRA